MKHNILLILALLILSIANAQDSIRGKDILKHIEYLSSDKMKGRFPGTKGIDKAASYIVSNFKKNGVKPVNNNYTQPFDIVIKLDPDKSNYVSINNKALSFSKDYSIYYFSGSAEVSAPVIQLDSNKAYSPNDFQKKWVAVWRKKNRSEYNIADSLSRLGAAGIIFVSPVSQNSLDDLVRIRPYKVTSLSIPVIQIKKATWDEISKTPLTSSQSLAASIKLISQKVKTKNIIGCIEGSDPILKNEYIVLGAHYDHLGMGGYGTGSLKPDTIAIHNGADDNASGVAALMEIAKDIAHNKTTFKRSILFIAFSAEEEGLLGSDYFVNNPLIPLSAIKIMINMDMVGRLNTEKQLYMGGAGTFPGGVQLMTQMGDNSGLNPVVNAGDVGGTDHVSFYRKNIPVLGFHTGGHPQYHKPEDDANLINYYGEVLICKYIYNTMLYLSNNQTDWTFTKQN